MQQQIRQLLLPVVCIRCQQPPVLTKEMVQEMIVSVFSTLGLQGNATSSTSSGVLDSGATNLMTNSLWGLVNLRKYRGLSQVQIANGSILSIVVVGDKPPLKDIYVSPRLAVNLASIGQFVDNNYKVKFHKSKINYQNERHINIDVITQFWVIPQNYPKITKK